VGNYLSSGVYHAFLKDGAAFTSLDIPGASSTLATGINDSGVIAGYYTDASGVTHGFVTTTPEPLSATLLLIGLAAFAGLRRSLLSHG